MKTNALTCLLAALLLTCPAWAQQVDVGSTVTMNYIITLKDGKELTRTDKPVTFTVGSNSVLPDLQQGMVGMKKGEKRAITLAPEEAFGPVDPKLIGEIPIANLPEEGRSVGAVVSGRDKNGQPMFARVLEVKEDTAVVDANHPWAGKTLIFNVDVLEVKPKQ